jgi:hypothetical protein
MSESNKITKKKKHRSSSKTPKNRKRSENKAKPPEELSVDLPRVEISITGENSDQSIEG